MCDHGHNHNHGGHGHGGNGGHNHGHGHSCSHEAEEVSTNFNLYLKIDTANLEVLNEMEEGSGPNIFKPWDDRMNLDKYVESDCDPELLINIPFTGNVKLKSIAILGGEDDFHPKTMKLYKNIPNMSFDMTEKEPQQEFVLPRDYNDVIKLPVKVQKFSSVNHLSIFIKDNYGEETTKIYYIGLAGEFSAAQKNPIILTNYELSANPADHKNKLFDTAGHMIN